MAMLTPPAPLRMLQISPITSEQMHEVLSAFFTMAKANLLPDSLRSTRSRIGLILHAVTATPMMSAITLTKINTTIKTMAIIYDTPACYDLVEKLLQQKYNVKLFSIKNTSEFNQSQHLFKHSKNANFQMYHIDPETFNNDIKDVDCIVNMKCYPEKFT